MTYSQGITKDTMAAYYGTYHNAAPAATYGSSSWLSCSANTPTLGVDKPADPGANRIMYVGWDGLIDNVPNKEDVCGFYISYRHYFNQDWDTSYYPPSLIGVYKIRESWDASTVCWNDKPAIDSDWYTSYYWSGINDYPSQQWDTINVTLPVIESFGDAGVYGIALHHPVGWFDWYTGWYGNVCANYYSGEASSDRNARFVAYYLSDYSYNWQLTTSEVCPAGNTVGLTATGRAYISSISQSSPYGLTVQIKPPWESGYESAESLAVGDSAIYSRTGAGYVEYFQVRYNSTGYDATEGYYPIFYIHWWRTTEHRYVEAGGKNTDDGTTWALAWKTYGYAMENAPAGCILHCSFDAFSAEASPNTLSPVNENVTILYETETTGGGTGSTEIEILR